MKIAFFETESWEQAHAASILSGHELMFCSEPLTESNSHEYKDANILSINVHSKISSAILDEMSRVKMIGTRSTGFDHIDLGVTKQRHIIVTNVPQYGSITVAEHTWAMILALSRRIFESYDRTEASNFSSVGLRGFDLYDKTLGIIGLGAIGRHVALMSRGFNMKLRVLNPHHDQEYANQFANFTYVDRIEDIFTHSDVVSFHAPLTKETYHMLNQSNYSFLKPGSVVVNTSRGALIETQALVKALEEKRIRGAGLDVLESEELMQPTSTSPIKIPAEHELAEVYLNHRLIGMDNVLITPHNAFNSDESVYRKIDGNLDSIRSFIEVGDRCINQVYGE